MQQPNEQEKLVRKALKLYNQGRTYAAVGEAMGVSTTKAWRLCNVERNRANVRESVKRYQDRGCTALVDMP